MMSTARKDPPQIYPSPVKDQDFAQHTENEIPLDLSQISKVIL